MLSDGFNRKYSGRMRVASPARNPLSSLKVSSPVSDPHTVVQRCPGSRSNLHKISRLKVLEPWRQPQAKDPSTHRNPAPESRGASSPVDRLSSLKAAPPETTRLHMEFVRPTAPSTFTLESTWGWAATSNKEVRQTTGTQRQVIGTQRSRLSSLKAVTETAWPIAHPYRLVVLRHHLGRTLSCLKVPGMEDKHETRAAHARRLGGRTGWPYRPAFKHESHCASISLGYATAAQVTRSNALGRP